MCIGCTHADSITKWHMGILVCHRWNDQGAPCKELAARLLRRNDVSSATCEFLMKEDQCRGHKIAPTKSA